MAQRETLAKMPTSCQCAICMWQMPEAPAFARTFPTETQLRAVAGALARQSRKTPHFKCGLHVTADVVTSLRLCSQKLWSKQPPATRRPAPGMEQRGAQMRHRWKRRIRWDPVRHCFRSITLRSFNVGQNHLSELSPGMPSLSLKKGCVFPPGNSESLNAPFSSSCFGCQEAQSQIHTSPLVMM